MNVGEKFTGPQWSQQRAEEGTIVKVTVVGQVTTRNQFVVGCREYGLGPLILLPGFTITPVDDGLHEVTAHVEVDNLGRIKTLPGRDPLTPATVAEHIKSVEVINVTDYGPLPPGLYRCGNHSHDWLYLGHDRWMQYERDSRRPWISGATPPSDTCTPVLCGSFWSASGGVVISPVPTPSRLRHPSLAEARKRGREIAPRD
jgi:hypothetical protein